MKICDLLKIYKMSDNMRYDNYEETWNLDNGVYQGRITELKPVKSGTKYLLKVVVESQKKVFMNSTLTSWYEKEPMRCLTDGLTNVEAAKGRIIEFSIRNTVGGRGVVFSNITSVSYI